MRYLYSIIKLWQYRHRLKLYLDQSSNKNISYLTQINRQFLENLQIRCLALDFDGVLNSHGTPKVREDIKHWINAIQKELSDLQIYILSNKASKTREQYFTNNFERITFVAGVKKKPYPDGLLAIKNLARITDNKQILMVDDRLATGILSAEIVGCNACLITKAYTNFNSKPVIESFFWILRFVERYIIRIIG